MASAARLGVEDGRSVVTAGRRLATAAHRATSPGRSCDGSAGRSCGRSAARGFVLAGGSGAGSDARKCGDSGQSGSGGYGESPDGDSPRSVSASCARKCGASGQGVSTPDRGGGAAGSASPVSTSRRCGSGHDGGFVWFGRATGMSLPVLLVGARIHDPTPGRKETLREGSERWGVRLVYGRAANPSVTRDSARRQRRTSPRASGSYDSASRPPSPPLHARSSRRMPVPTNTPRNAYTWSTPVRTSDRIPSAPQIP